MKCSSCNAELDSSVKFCSVCGTPVVSLNEAPESAEEVMDDVDEVPKDATEEAIEEVAVSAEPEVVSESEAPVEETIEEVTVSAEPEVVSAPEVPAEETIEEAKVVNLVSLPDNSNTVEVEEVKDVPIAKFDPGAPIIEDVQDSTPVPTPVVAAVPVVEATPVVVDTVIEEPMTSVSSMEDFTPVNQPQYQTEEEKKDQPIVLPPEYKPLSTAGAFFLLLLYTIPVIGFIFSIILTVAGKKKSRKNLSRAVMIWYIIALVIMITLCILSVIFFKDLVEHVIYAPSIEDAVNAIQDFIDSQLQ